MQDSQSLNLLADTASTANKQINKRCFIVTDGEISFGTASDRIQRLRRLYRDAGLKAGDRVVLSSIDNAEASILFLSLFLTGVTAVLPDPSIKPDQASNLITSFRPQGFIIDAKLEQTWHPTEGFILAIEDSRGKKGAWSRLLPKKKPATEAHTYPAILENIPPADWPYDSIACLPAAVFVNAGGRQANIDRLEIIQKLESIRSVLNLTPESKILINHSVMSPAGLLLGPLAAFASNAAVYLPGSSKDAAGVGSLLDAVYRHRITHFVADSLVLPEIRSSHKHRIDSFHTPEFQMIVSTGQALSSQMRKDFESGFRTKLVDLGGPGGPVDGLFARGELGAISSAAREAWLKDLEARIIQAAAPCFKEAPVNISLETGLHDTKGWDSFAHLELITVLETQFKIQLTSSETMRIKRLKDAFTIVAEKLS